MNSSETELTVRILKVYGPVIVCLAVSLALSKRYSWSIIHTILMTWFIIWGSYTVIPAITKLVTGDPEYFISQLIWGAIISVMLASVSAVAYVPIIMIFKSI
jgi:hypothetical protein